jgi:hypothetical protein
MESMVRAADDGPVDFEHPAAHPTQSAMSIAFLIKATGARLETGRLNSFERDFIFSSLPSNISQ